MKTKQIKQAEKALAELFKELILLPTKIDNEDCLILFTDMILAEFEKHYEQLMKIGGYENGNEN